MQRQNERDALIEPSKSREIPIRKNGLHLLQKQPVAAKSSKSEKSAAILALARIAALTFPIGISDGVILLLPSDPSDSQTHIPSLPTS